MQGTMLASMRRWSRLGKVVFGALLLLAAPAFAARELQVAVAAVRSEAASVSALDVRLQWPAGEPAGELVLRAERIEVPSLGESFSDIEWRCPLSLDGQGQWRCDGPVRSAAGRALASVSLSAASLDASLRLGSSRVAYASRAAAPDRPRITLEAVPVAWLKAFLAGLWAEGQWTSGRMSGQVDLWLPESAPLQARARLDIADLGLETPDGWLAAAGLGGRLELDYVPSGDLARVHTRFVARGGEFLAQGLYAQLPATPVELQVELHQQRGGEWTLPAFSLRDGGVLQARGHARLGADGSVADLELDLALGELAVARDRYLSGFLAPAGFPDLVLAGAATAQLTLHQGRLQAMSLALEQVNAVDPRQRFTLAGLQGGLRWTAAAEPLSSTLGWDNAALFGIGLGPARLGFASADGQLRLREPVALPVLDGQARLEHLRWQPPGGGQGARFQLGVSLESLDLGSLSQRLGWPAFTGTVGGRIPSARYEDNVLTLDGGLAMQVFGGTVSLSELVMERPFGVAPTLSADVAIEDIDMEPMTSAFGFGAITGRMDGRIGGLRMVDWSPVAFDARLGSDPAWKGRRRISQRAVEDISKIGGGGGLMGGLQAQALRLFDDFRYARIGLACRLRDNVCTMDGVDSAGDGYTIVQGAGLPRIQVVGFRRRVDWPTLVARLEAATEGTAPVID